MLTPEEVKKLNAIREGKNAVPLASIKDIENSIDQRLAQGELRYCYSDNFYEEIPRDRKNLVEALYKDKGWKISYARDNGNTIYFSS